MDNREHPRETGRVSGRNGTAEQVRMNQATVNPNLASAFYRHAVADPERLALVVDGGSYAYRALAGISQRVAYLLGRPARVGVLASRTLEAFAGVLGTLWAGAAYVPIDPNVPDERLIQLLGITVPDAIVADRAGLERYGQRAINRARAPAVHRHAGSAAFPGGEVWDRFRRDRLRSEPSGKHRQYYGAD